MRNDVTVTIFGVLKKRERCNRYIFLKRQVTVTKLLFHFLERVSNENDGAVTFFKRQVTETM
jgi:hypothetical protein